MIDSSNKVGSGFKEGTVEADGFKIRYLESGSGMPVVTLHNARGLRATPADGLLARDHRMILLEMPGFGDEPNERTKTIEELAGTMLKACDALGLERFNLLGTSFGGKVAVVAALQAGDRLDSLILVSPGAVMLPNQQQPADPADRIATMWAHPDRFPDEISPARTGHGMALMTQVGGMGRDEPLIARLGEITTPTMVLFGTNDGWTKPENGRVYRERIQNCSLVFVYDAAHFIAIERPEAMAEVVSDFLERHEVFVVSRKSTLINP